MLYIILIKKIKNLKYIDYNRGKLINILSGIYILLTSQMFYATILCLFNVNSIYSEFRKEGKSSFIAKAAYHGKSCHGGRL